jgi:predicted pyridoxine 5'-phosphate oxidase superfamily flavin-nucleotide-binding protein
MDRKGVSEMIPEKLRQVLSHEGVVALATQSDGGPHLVNTWNSYIQVTETGSLLIPAGFMKVTEANVAKNNKVLVTLGSREVEGAHGPGTGFLIEGLATFKTSGAQFEAVKKRFSWARAALEVTIVSVTQTL